MTTETEIKQLPPELQNFRNQLKCSFEQIDDVFEACIIDAQTRLTNQGVQNYLKGASLICMIGRGVEPVLQFMEIIPELAGRLGEEVITLISDGVWEVSRTPNGVSIPPFMATLQEAGRRLGSLEQFENYLSILFDMMERTTGSIHGHHTTQPSPGLPDLLLQMPYLLSQISLEGLKNWIDYGVRNYGNHPERQIDYFTLQSADSRAMMQRERHGTLFADNERNLGMYLQGLWDDKEYLIPYSTGFDELRQPIPYYDKLGMRIPDVFDDFIKTTTDGDVTITGINRYRAVLAHMVSHRRWSSQIVADNFSPFQRISIDLLEDSRVEYLAMKEYPGLRNLWLSLHPVPVEGECNEKGVSCIRHRLAMLSYALLNPNHGYEDKDILLTVQQFHEFMENAEMSGTETSTKDMVNFGLGFITRTRRQEDQAAKIFFNNTVVDYRDDNRAIWVFIEEGDDEEQFENEPRKAEEEEEIPALPPRHYPEWDYNTKSYRPDWVSLYESLHPSGNPADIDKLLDKHAGLAKRLKQILDMLKPQSYVRVRYQEEGSELDLDVAIRSLIDYKSGAQPDTRINMSHKHDDRDIAVTLLLDLSASIDDVPHGSTQSLLEISQEAVSLLGWAIDDLDDKFSIAGFFSNTRHDVRYLHMKGFKERWNDEVKARVAKMEAGFSTRMGAAMRHAGHYLAGQKADKKLLLILTDGEPSDIDVDDDKLLIKDAHKAVGELGADGIYTHCISLDPNADEYVSDIFGSNYTVIDNVNRLPEKLPQLFMALTK
jgi:fructose-specific component phosphotransferase system IIB-like protein